MDKFLFLVVSINSDVIRYWGTNIDVKRMMDDDTTAVVIRGNQTAVEHNDIVVWADVGVDGDS